MPADDVRYSGTDDLVVAPYRRQSLGVADKGGSPHQRVPGIRRQNLIGQSQAGQEGASLFEFATPCECGD
jgi:hypothetical protein